MNDFKDVLNKGAIPIGQSDVFGKSLCQFDLIDYNNEKYIIIWNPVDNIFIGSHESGNSISHLDLHKSKWIKNLKNV